MTEMFVRAQIAGAMLMTSLESRVTRRNQHGAVTVEQVFWVAGLLALAGLVYAAVSAYTKGQIAKIN